MSYVIQIFNEQVPSDDAAAWKFREAAIEQGSGGETPKVFYDLIDRLMARFPCICDLDEDSDDGVWSDGPLRDVEGQQYLALGLVFPKVAQALPFIIQTANELGLVVFDEQVAKIHRPGQSHQSQTTIARTAANREKIEAKPWWRFWA